MCLDSPDNLIYCMINVFQENKFDEDDDRESYNVGDLSIDK